MTDSPLDRRSPFRAVGRFLSEPFHGPRGFSWTLFLLFTGIHALVGYNAVYHDPNASYDSYHHSRYMTAVSEGRLPTAQETEEFYTPPLPYLFPAAVKAFAGVTDTKAFRAALFLHVGLSVALCLLLLRICDLFRPRCLPMKWGALGLLGMQAVYYRTLAFVRGEPLFAVLGLIAILVLVKDVRTKDESPLRRIVLSLTCGLLLLTRPTALFLLAGVGVVGMGMAIRWRVHRRWVVRAAMASVLMAALMAGWFYLGRYRQYGMIFNRKATPVSLGNLPGKFYWGLGDGKLFSEPFMPNFQDQFIPVFYAEWWGDYYGFFLVYARRAHRVDGRVHISDRTLPVTDSWNWVETNYYTRVPYLGRANVAALIPTGLMLFAWGWCVAGWVAAMFRCEPDPLLLMRGLLAGAVAGLMLGMLYVVLRYPDTIPLGAVKATYVFPIFPLLAIMGGDLLAEVRSRSTAAFVALIVGLAAVGLHNCATFVTVMPR